MAEPITDPVLLEALNRRGWLSPRAKAEWMAAKAAGATFAAGTDQPAYLSRADVENPHDMIRHAHAMADAQSITFEAAVERLAGLLDG